MNINTKKLIPWGMVMSALAGGLFFLRSQYERDQLTTELYTIESSKIKGNGKRLVFLTDLHDKEFGPDNQRLLDAIRKANPDLVLVGGDMMVAKGVGDLSRSISFLSRLSKEYPVICANGNHENRLRDEKETYGEKYMAYRHALKEMGITFLSDRNVSLDDEIECCGLNLLPKHYKPGYPKMKRGFVRSVLGEPDAEKFTILMAHSPMFFPEYAEWGADLTLSGHFHGGTIRIPLIGGLMTPQYQFFFPWCSGLVEGINGRKMIVGRGLGTHSINIRINDKPQIVVVDIKRKD